MYETMVYWETADSAPEQAAVERDFTEVWKAADKVVYSRTLESVGSARTRIEREFDPEDVRRMKASAERDITVGGSGIAALALAAGLVDELQLLIVPAIVGGGKAALPDDIRLDLELLDERRFANGAVFLSYRVGA